MYVTDTIILRPINVFFSFIQVELYIPVTTDSASALVLNSVVQEHLEEFTLYFTYELHQIITLPPVGVRTL